jgi:predicted component of type VI protein secretion system
LKEQLEKVIRLKQELEKLLQIAVNQGASEEEINRLLDDYNYAKRLIEIIQKKMNNGDQ